MKKLLILTTFLSSLIITSLANAEWTKVTKRSDGGTYYVDFERTSRHDGKVYFWCLKDYGKLGYKGTMSSEIYIEAECGHLRYRFLNQTYYNGPMRSGKTLHKNHTSEKDWRYPSPNSASEEVLLAVCNHMFDQ